MRTSIPPLTSFRFFAALLVVMFHYERSHPLFPYGLGNFGYEAVTFFFILSGFILTYVHAVSSGLNVSGAHFAISRVGRIAPAYLLALFASAPFFLTSSLKAESIHSLWLGFALVPPMLQSWWPPAALLWNGPAWSLSNEIFFYAMYPMIWDTWRRLTPTLALPLAYLLVLAVALFRAYCPEDIPVWSNFSAYFPLLNLPQFILGVALGKAFLARGPIRSSNIALVTSIVLLCLIIMNKLSQPWLTNNAVLCLIFGTIVFSLAGVRSGLRRILSAHAFVKLGEASYAMYILHFPIWLWWHKIVAVWLKIEIRPEFDFLAYLSVVFVLSIVTAKLIEEPCRRWILAQFYNRWLTPRDFKAPNVVSSNQSRDAK